VVCALHLQATCVGPPSAVCSVAVAGKRFMHTVRQLVLQLSCFEPNNSGNISQRVAAETS